MRSLASERRQILSCEPLSTVELLAVTMAWGYLYAIEKFEG